ncbi:MAG: ATP-binding protein, partial [Deltaproteobacteria bacterium]|nr:ATP-binding protein [Deltaproteobacteria bacterium]
MIPRRRQLERLHKQLRTSPVVAILGARQVGKTTLARAFANQMDSPRTWFDLEDPVDLRRLDDPGLALRPLKGLVVLDEVQRRPDLFPLLRVLVDRSPNPARFLVLGSASPDLLRQGSESLAGRIAFHRLEGFALDEVGTNRRDDLWVRGSFPRAFLAPDDTSSFEWRLDFVQTFLERDLPQLGIGVAASTMRRFWTMLAHWHGQLWNGSQIGRAFGVSDHTVRRYLDHLQSTYMVRVVQPWKANTAKRQVKSPKVYIADPGLLHALLGLPTKRDVEG